MNSAKINKSYHWVITLDEQNIRRLYSEILNLLGKDKNEKHNIIITIDYSDHSSFKTQRLEDLLSDENIKRRKIVRLLINGKSGVKKVSILFGGKENVHHLEIEGPDRQWIYVTKSIIEDRIKDFRESRPRTGFLIFLTVLGLLLINYFFASYLQPYLPPLFTPLENGKREIGTGIIVLFVINLPILLLLCYIILNLFPNLTFLIGKEIDNHNSRVRTRSNLFYGVFVAFIITVVIALLSKYL